MDVAYRDHLVIVAHLDWVLRTIYQGIGQYNPNAQGKMLTWCRCNWALIYMGLANTVYILLVTRATDPLIAVNIVWLIIGILQAASRLVNRYLFNEPFLELFRWLNGIYSQAEIAQLEATTVRKLTTINRFERVFFK